jgi:hypothetical protein
LFELWSLPGGTADPVKLVELFQPVVDAIDLAIWFFSRVSYDIIVA